jgi:hypothetical protein
MAGAKGLGNIISSILSKIAPKKTQAKVSVQKEKSKESPFADKINEDKLNKAEQKTVVKGKKKFLEDVSIYTMFQMISLFWSRKVVGPFLNKMPSPVEYGSSPTIMRRISHDRVVQKMSKQVVHHGSPSYTYGLTKKQIRNVVKKEVRSNPKEYRTFKGNRYTGKIKNTVAEKAVKRDAFKELMAKRMAEKSYER